MHYCCSGVEDLWIRGSEWKTEYRVVTPEHNVGHEACVKYVIVTVMCPGLESTTFVTLCRSQLRHLHLFDPTTLRLALLPSL